MKSIWILLSVVLTLAAILTLRQAGVFDARPNTTISASESSASLAASAKAAKYKIAFATKASTISSPDVWQINVINDDSSGQTRLTDTNGFPEPRWSPDNKAIAFLSKEDKGQTGIYVMNADGSNQKRLTSNDSWASCPGWSPGGEKIAFVSNMFSIQEDKDDICVMNIDGSKSTRLTSISSDHADPCWSPDGKKIAFSHKLDNHDQIYIMNADGSNQTQITNSTANSMMPSWTPDGRRIAFTLENGGNYQIYLMNADGSNQIALTEPGTNNLGPFVSSDGSKIAFVSNRDKNDNIYIMNIDGSNQTRLTYSDINSDLCPSWSPTPFYIPEGPSLTTITNSEDGFSIDYPSDWHIISNSLGTMINTPEKNDGLIFVSTIPTLSSILPNTLEEPIETKLSKEIDSIKRSYKNVKLIESQKFSGTWDWHIAYDSTIEIDGKDVAFHDEAYYKWTKTTTYELTQGSRKANFDKYPFKEMATSFKLIPK